MLGYRRDAGEGTASDEAAFGRRLSGLKLALKLWELDLGGLLQVLEKPKGIKCFTVLYSRWEVERPLAVCCGAGGWQKTPGAKLGEFADVDAADNLPFPDAAGGKADNVMKTTTLETELQNLQEFSFMDRRGRRGCRDVAVRQWPAVFDSGKTVERPSALCADASVDADSGWPGVQIRLRLRIAAGFWRL